MKRMRQDVQVKAISLDEDLSELVVMKLREPDANECRASMGMEPNLVLLHAIHTSSWAKKVLLNDKIVAVFGVCKEGEKIGIPWWLSTDDVENYPVEVIRQCHVWVKKMQEEFPILLNLVGAENECTIRLLRLLGFTVSDWTKVLDDPDYEFKVFFWKRSNTKEVENV